MVQTINVSQQNTVQGVSVNQESPAQNMALSNGTKFMRGEPGVTFTPCVDEDGNLSWTNDKGFENPETVNIKGPVGDSYVLTEADKASIAALVPLPDVSGQVNAHNVATDAHNDIRLLIGGLTSRLNALADSDDTTLDQLSEVVAYIKANRELIDSVTTAKVNVSDIVDNLTTNVADRPLSAAQGVALKGLIDAITVPTKVSELENDAGYIGEADKEALIAEIADSILYTDLSYIQTDGKAYILTDFIPTSKTRVRMRGFFPLGSSTKSMFGAMTSTSSNRFDCGSNSSSKYLIGWNKTTAASSLAEIEEPFEVDMNRNVLYINGEQVATIAEAEWTGEYPLAIFARNVKGTVGSTINSGSQVEWMEIYEDDVLVRDFVPRKHLTDGCGLYDRLAGKFWGNAYTSGALTGA